MPHILFSLRWSYCLFQFCCFSNKPTFCLAQLASPAQPLPFTALIIHLCSQISCQSFKLHIFFQRGECIITLLKLFFFKYIYHSLTGLYTITYCEYWFVFLYLHPGIILIVALGWNTVFLNRILFVYESRNCSSKQLFITVEYRGAPLMLKTGSIKK
jgi:hypothetical protein